ncbi:unnamed protein product [Cercopithifilaria johnstoni]|uniref:Uncharacterized protein n=1 Tax=Cercopithifilaria johnstoni TaxID=2874296 RepID=A0A8J2MN97_9BILA|nr:unnamed protein product [Cercopithifilaria johnstoni]
MYKDNENRYDNDDDELPRRLLRWPSILPRPFAWKKSYDTDDNKVPRRLVWWPNILTRPFAWKKSPSTPISSESAILDPKPCSTKMAESGSNKMEGTPSAEDKFDNNSLEELLRENGLLPAIEDVPVAGGQEVVEEAEENRIHTIGIPLAEQALRALRIVSRHESRFQLTLPEEASGEEESPVIVFRTPTIIRIKKKWSGVQEASIYDPSVRMQMRKAVDEAIAVKPDDIPSTSRGYTSSIPESGEATDEEKAIINELLPLCGLFNSIDYTDPTWYYKLKKIIFLRVNQLEQEYKNAMSMGDELRKRNEELRSLHNNITLQSVISGPQYSYEEIITNPSTEDLGPHFPISPDSSLQDLDAQFQVLPDPSIEDLNAEFQICSGPSTEYLNPQYQDLSGTSAQDLDPQQPRWP